MKNIIISTGDTMSEEYDGPIILGNTKEPEMGFSAYQVVGIQQVDGYRAQEGGSSLPETIPVDLLEFVSKKVEEYFYTVYPFDKEAYNPYIFNGFFMEDGVIIAVGIERGPDGTRVHIPYEDFIQFCSNGNA